MFLVVKVKAKSIHEYGIQFDIWSKWTIDYMYLLNTLTVES
jgi:hypothetical protein